MDKRIVKILNDYVKKVSEQTPGFVTAYLFGSYARNKHKPESDIDIALIIDNMGDDEKFDLQVQFMLLAAQVDSRIEPHPFSNEDFYSNNPFVSEIKKTGIEILPQMPDDTHRM